MQEIVFAVDVVIEPDEPGFHAYCPSLKGLHVSGDTREEALHNARDAITAYIRSLVKHGDPIPVGVRIAEAETARLGEHATRHTEEFKLALSTV